MCAMREVQNILWEEELQSTIIHMTLHKQICYCLRNREIECMNEESRCLYRSQRSTRYPEHTKMWCLFVMQAVVASLTDKCIMLSDESMCMADTCNKKQTWIHMYMHGWWKNERTGGGEEWGGKRRLNKRREANNSWLYLSLYCTVMAKLSKVLPKT